MIFDWLKGQDSIPPMFPGWFWGGQGFFIPHRIGHSLKVAARYKPRYWLNAQMMEADRQASISQMIQTRWSIEMRIARSQIRYNIAMAEQKRIMGLAVGTVLLAEL